MSKFQITYLVDSNSADDLFHSIKVEQTTEFPFELSPEWIQNEIVGQLISKNEKQNKTEIIIQYDLAITGKELPQLLNIIWGNISMYPNVKIINLSFSNELLQFLKGPRFGISGLRKKLNVSSRPILATALKPMGLSSTEFAQMAKTLVEAGFDLIKDDQSLANQTWAQWLERVKIISQTVNEANSKFGKNTIYAPSLNRPADEIADCAFEAKSFGAGAFLVMPGVFGFDTMRMLADNDELALPIMSHPSMLGSFFMDQNQGLTHELVLGTLNRISGADICIFPNFGGRFSFTPEECLSISNSCRNDMSHINKIWPSPGGGMTIERIPEIINFYGNDTILLIGGALHRNNLFNNAKELFELVNKLES
ncbi:MAG: hypothetical protein RIS18_541 [Actinomycetota bacterium]|jgi:ribulose-bisphosphate carboxylase large chain